MPHYALDVVVDLEELPDAVVGARHSLLVAERDAVSDEGVVREVFDISLDLGSDEFVGSVGEWLLGVGECFSVPLVFGSVADE